MEKREIILDKDKILKRGLPATPEVIELQRILHLIPDGIFGARTAIELKSEFNCAEIRLSTLADLGIPIRTAIPIKEVYWLDQSID